MPRFNQIKQPENNPELEAAYDIARSIGFVGVEEGVPNNLCTVFSERPDLLQHLLSFIKPVLTEGVLPPTVKQMIAMTIAMQNDCRYCAVAHTWALEAMGVPEEVIKSCASDPDLADLPPPQRAILKFALKIARNPKSGTDEDFRTLRDFGLSDGEIIEIIMMVGYSTLTDMLADVTEVPLDGEG